MACGLSIEHRPRRRVARRLRRGPALLAGLWLGLSTTGCGPRIETTAYTLALARLDAADSAAGGTALVDLHELFVSEQRIVYKRQEFPANLNEVRVLTVDGNAVPPWAGFGVIAPGRHVFELTIKTATHEVLDRSLTLFGAHSDKSIETRELLSRRRLTLHLRPDTLLRFDREGRHAVEPLSESIFGPEGSCRREGTKDRLCRKCSREDGSANCVRKLHRGYYEAGS